jgi:hypothetical protein
LCERETEKILGSERPLMKERIKKFAARAHAYICTYHHLEQEQQAVAENENLDVASVPAPKQELFCTEI